MPNIRTIKGQILDQLSRIDKLIVRLEKEITSAPEMPIRDLKMYANDIKTQAYELNKLVTLRAIQIKSNQLNPNSMSNKTKEQPKETTMKVVEKDETPNTDTAGDIAESQASAHLDEEEEVIAEAITGTSEDTVHEALNQTEEERNNADRASI